MKEYYDKTTNLTWNTKEFEPMTWTEAIEFANTFKKGKWRLPTIQELLTLVDYTRSEPAIDTTIFTNVNSFDYWSASSDAYNSDNAWYTDFHFGYSSNYDKYASKYVRLVCEGDKNERILYEALPVLLVPLLLLLLIFIINNYELI